MLLNEEEGKRGGWEGGKCGRPSERNGDSMTHLGRAANHHPFSNFTRQNVETKRGSILKPGLRVSHIRNIFAVIT